MLNIILVISQLVFSGVICVYFFNQLRNQKSSKNALLAESKKQLAKLRKMRSVKLNVPLSEKTRPSDLSQIVGQSEGVKALTASLCGPNPQHVIIYGPAGVGKTAAARVVMEQAKRMGMSPFGADAEFIETDATTMRFDERSVADPLIGSVHDPIYQGAGAYGVAGIPQPKPGAVTKAHGGILFIDEIGELHPAQLNRLLKVLEDRRVYFESAYYSSEDANIPAHIHDVFKNGLPADFRLIGATTRSPESIPDAIRSRCVEIFFSPLEAADLHKIVRIATGKLAVHVEEGVEDLVCTYAKNGRDAVNILQTAASCAIVEGRGTITLKDTEWVVQASRLTPKIEMKILPGKRVGRIHALAVSGMSEGRIMEIEVNAAKVAAGTGDVVVTGIVEEESFDAANRHLSRKSSARASVENVITLLESLTQIAPSDYDIHINFPGGMPVDGPSAGVAIFCAVYSAITGKPIDNTVAMTGEVSIHGTVKPVGGVASKVLAAQAAGAKKVYIPADNQQRRFSDMEPEVVGVDTVNDLLRYVFDVGAESTNVIRHAPENFGVISASPAQNS